MWSLCNIKGNLSLSAPAWRHTQDAFFRAGGTIHFAFNDETPALNFLTKRRILRTLE